MTDIMNKNIVDYRSSVSKARPGFIRRALAVSSLLVLSNSAVPTMFHDFISCSVPENGQPFLYDNVLDVVVEHPFSSIEGSIVFLAFYRTVLEGGRYGEAPDAAIGYCLFTQNEKPFLADAFPSDIAGTYRQLNLTQ